MRKRTSWRSIGELWKATVAHAGRLLSTLARRCWPLDAHLRDITHKSPSERRSSFREPSTDEHGVPKLKRRLIAESPLTTKTRRPLHRQLHARTRRGRFQASQDIEHERRFFRADPSKVRGAPVPGSIDTILDHQCSLVSSSRRQDGALRVRAAAKDIGGQYARIGHLGCRAYVGVQPCSLLVCRVGGTRNRRQAQREPQTMLVQPVPPKRSRASDSSRSHTPEVKKPRGPARPHSSYGDDDASGKGSSARGRSAAASEDGSKETSRENSDMSDDDDDDDDIGDGNGPPVKPYMFSAISKVLQSNGGGGVMSAVTRMRKVRCSRQLRSFDLLALFALTSQQQQLDPTHRWQTSTWLTGAADAQESPMGAAVKSSVSRPLGPNASPLGRPTTSVDGSPVSVPTPQRSAEDVKSQLPRPSASPQIAQASPISQVKPATTERVDAAPLESSLRQPAVEPRPTPVASADVTAPAPSPQQIVKVDTDTNPAPVSSIAAPRRRMRQSAADLGTSSNSTRSPSHRSCFHQQRLTLVLPSSTAAAVDVPATPAAPSIAQPEPVTPAKTTLADVSMTSDLSDPQQRRTSGRSTSSSRDGRWSDSL